VINNRKVMILNFKIYFHWDALEKQEYHIIELISKIKNESLNYKRVRIIIEREDKILEIVGLSYTAFFQPGLSRYMFKIENCNEKVR
jgi:hypothetical protein